MSDLIVYRSPGRAWASAILAIPFLLAGLDLLLIPRLFPQYVRRLDVLADEMGLNRISSTGPEEPWALVFLVVGGGLLAWALKELIFPRATMLVNERGVHFSSLLGPAGGALLVPANEILEVSPALLNEDEEQVATVAFRFAAPERLPSNPWGAVWVADTLFVRVSGWTEKPGTIARAFADPGLAQTEAELPADLSSKEDGADQPEDQPGISGMIADLDVIPPAVTRVEQDPTDTTDRSRAYQARSRVYIGSVLALAGAIFALFLWIAGTDTNAYFLFPAAVGVGGGLFALLALRDYLESL